MSTDQHTPEEASHKEQEGRSELYYDKAHCGPLGDFGPPETRTGFPRNETDALGYCRYFLKPEHSDWTAEQILNGYPKLEVAGKLLHASRGYGFLNCRNTVLQAREEGWLLEMNTISQTIDLVL